MPDIARLSIEVTPKGIADAKRQLDQLSASAGQTQEKAGGMMGTFKNLQSIMQGPVAAFQAVSQVMQQVIAAGAELVNAFAESEQGIAKLEAVLAATGSAANLSSGDIQDLASEMQRLTLFEDDAVIAAQTVLLTFKQIGQDEFPRATRAAADMATVMGMDLQSAITLVGKALNEPVEGMAALRRVGVQLTDDQEALIKTMMETNDIAGAQAVIMGELEGQFGGAAEAAADTATGAFVQYKNAVSALKEEIGALIAEGFAPLTRALTEYIQVEASLASMSRLIRELQNGTRELNQDSFGQLLDSLKSIEDEMKRIEEGGVNLFEADQYRGLQQQYQRIQAAVQGYREEILAAEVAQDRLFSRQGGGQRPSTAVVTAETGTGQTPAQLEISADFVKRRIAAMEASRLELALINREMREGILSREEGENRIVAALDREREALFRLDEDGMQSGTLEARLVAIKTILTEMAGLVGPVQQVQQEIEGLDKATSDYTETLKGLGGPTVTEQAEKLAAAFKAIQDVFPQAARDAFIDSFMALGDALYSGTSAGESLLDAMGNVLNQIINQLPMMLLNAGLMAISAGNLPVGIALIGASGLVAVGAGFMNSAQSAAESRSSNSSVSSPQARQVAPGANTKVEINNYSGATATATETTGPNGERQIKVLIESAVKAGMAQGKFDGVMSRYGMRPQGVRT